MLYHVKLTNTKGQSVLVHHELLGEVFPGNDPGVTICLLTVGRDRNDVTYLPVRNTVDEIGKRLEEIADGEKQRIKKGSGV